MSVVDRSRTQRRLVNDGEAVIQKFTKGNAKVDSGILPAGNEKLDTRRKGAQRRENELRQGVVISERTYAKINRSRGTR